MILKKPLLDKSLKGNYAMGSIIKPLVALSALENKIITPETTFVCTGKNGLEIGIFTVGIAMGTGQ